MTNAPKLSTAADQDDDIDLLELGRNLWAGKWTIALFTVLGGVIAVFFVLRSEPVFRSDSLLQIEKRTASLAVPEAMQDLLSSQGGSPVETELEIMRSWLVLGEAVRQLDLQIVAEP